MNGENISGISLLVGPNKGNRAICVKDISCMEGGGILGNESR